MGAARTVISREASVPLTALAGGGALNYLLLVRIVSKQWQQIEELTSPITGIRQHLLDSSRYEDWPPTCALDHDAFRPRIYGLAS